MRSAQPRVKPTSLSLGWYAARKATIGYNGQWLGDCAARSAAHGSRWAAIVRKGIVMRWSFERFKHEIEDLQQDLNGLELSIPNCRIGDFACGWGYTTLGLMILVKNAECIGVDIFEKNLILNVPSIQDINEQIGELKKLVLSKTDLTNADENLKAIFNLINEGRIPKFQKGDIIKGKNLPSGLDIVYCKRLLQNVIDGGYPNIHKGSEGVSIAINHIAEAIKQGGIICLIEPAGTNFMTFLEKAGLELIRCCRVNRSEIIDNRRNLIYKAQFLVYHYRKP